MAPSVEDDSRVHITHFSAVGIREAPEQLDPFDAEERVVVRVDRRRAIEQLVEELDSLLPGVGFPIPGPEEPDRLPLARVRVYRGYARTEVRVRADAVRTAVTKSDVTREENQNRRALSDAEKSEEDLREEATQVGRRLAEASGSL